MQLLEILAMLILVANACIVNGDELSYDYYKYSCPQLETIAHRALLPILVADPRSSSAFLRLFFHDCQVQGCDASILLDTDSSRGISSEMESGKNFKVRNRNSIEVVKSMVERECPGTVSCADIIVLATREAVAYSGGPNIRVPLGRKDGVTASSLRADAYLPSSRMGVEGTLQLFMAKGMTVEETVAIMGGHTIGVGHCLNIVHRLYEQQEEPENLDAIYEEYLRLNCPTPIPLTNLSLVVNDLTPAIFDNHYYKDCLQGRGLFTIDSAMSIDPRTAPYVSLFAQDQDHFFRVFSSAFVKLSSAEVITGNGGEIRTICSQVN